VRAELESYDHGLADKTEIVALSKIDALSPEEIKQQAARIKRASKKAPLLLSAHSGMGVPEALRALLNVIDSSGGTTAARRRTEAAAWQP
jgi:GTP-binding protein